MKEDLVDKVTKKAIMIPTGGPIYDKSRAITAIKDTQENYESPHYIISGAMGKTNQNGIVDYGPNTRIEKILKDHGVSDENIIQEYKSRDTLGNIYETSKICEKEGIKRLGVVSEKAHINRIQYAYDLLNKLGCINEEIEIIPQEVKQENIPLKSKLRYFFYINASNIKDKLMLKKEIKRRY